MSGGSEGSAASLLVRIYYEDTDLGGVVYHANYLKFFERARTEWLRGLGVSQALLKERTGHVFVVTRCDVAFRQPARMDDLLDIETRIERVRGASLALAQIARLAERPGTASASGRVLAEAAVTVACLDGNGRPARLPPDVSARLSAERGG